MNVPRRPLRAQSAEGERPLHRGHGPLAPIAVFTGAVIKGFSPAVSAWLIGGAAVLPWLATNFKPELMIDPDEIYDEDEITEEQKDLTSKYQMRFIVLVVVIVALAFIAFIAF